MDLVHLKTVGLKTCFFESAVFARPAPVGKLTHQTQQELAAEVSPARCKEWEDLQNRLRSQLKDEDDDSWSLVELQRVGGLDISFENGTNKGTAVMVVCEMVKDAGLQLIYEDSIDVDMDLPYVSGFLFVRELPAFQELLRRLRRNAPHAEPGVFLVDGSGMYHPRQLGSASHFGIEENVRTIGVAKKLMVIGGDFEKEDGQRLDNVDLPNLGDYAEIIGTRTKRVFGMALRTSAVTASKKKQSEASNRRVYISVGHNISLMAARDVVLKCSDIAGGSYIPEPIRLADLTGRAIERAWQQLHAESPAEIRQLVLDVGNLLDDRQRRTLHGILEGREPAETLAAIPTEQLKRKRAVIEELFVPLRQLYPRATVAEVRVAAKIEKPWAIALKKGALTSQMPGEGMRL